MTSFLNPYSGAHFFTFFSLFFKRLFTFAPLAPDEIQVWVLLSVAASSSLVGCFLVLRRMTMLANALSHTIFLGVVLAYLGLMVFGASTSLTHGMSLTHALIAAFIAAFLTTFLVAFLLRFLTLQEDASIGLVFSSLFALGILLITYFSRNAHVGTELLMGNVDALQRGDLNLGWVTLAVNGAFFILLFKEFKLTSFDPLLAKSLGVSPFAFHLLLMFLTALTAITAFRAVGVLLVLAFISLPPLTARFFTHSLPKMCLLSVALGGVATLLGVAFSRHFLTIFGFGLSTAGLVVCVLALMFVGALLRSLLQTRALKAR